MSGIAILSLRNPVADFFTLVVGHGDLRSVLCLIVFSIVILVLAYLTNPSENSFRAYLTEQSFRHHLSRLDDSAHNSHVPNRFRSRYLSRNSTNSSTPLFAVDNAPPFHFANRASISLRTPKHVFHSFAVFTIAAMVPLSKASDRDPCLISDSWYIGAFGKWWRGGVFEEWYQDVIARSKDEESWSSGILNMKRLDMLEECNAPTFSVKNLPAHLSRGSPPRLRNRERSALRNNAMHHRTSSPPPLPKSASLPMHTVRKNSSNNRPGEQPTLPRPSVSNDSTCPISSAPSRSPSTLFEHSPLISEVLRQITSAKASVLDLRTQLTECQTAASQSRAVLQQEVGTHRERKRLEDVSKVELKSRTKTLEDSKRVAEGLKKEADKKLKAVQVIRDSAAHRMDHLDKETQGLQKELSEDRRFIADHGQVSVMGRDLAEALEQKRLEIKAAEESILILNQRSRELDERLASEKDRLQTLREKSDTLRQNRVPHIDDSSLQFFRHQESWPPAADLHNSPTAYAHTTDPWDLTSNAPNGHHGQLPSVYDESQVYAIGDANGLASIGAKNYARVDHASAFQGNSFSPFSDLSSNGLTASSDSASFDNGSPHFLNDLTGKEVDNGGAISRSFQSDSDPYVEKEWRQSSKQHHQPDGLSTVTASSPTSLHGPTFNTAEELSLAMQFPSYERQPFESPLQAQRSTWKHAKDESAFAFDPQDLEYPYFQGNAEKTGTRNWFSGIGKAKTGKGLNPSAKEFNLFRRAPDNGIVSKGHISSNPIYDALNPNGLGSSAGAASTSQSLLRAFAPSPAEREALQRSLGGSTNTSFERLPSLSDVGSIPASPTNAHARAHVPQVPLHDLGSILPAWLQSLPRTRKANFSPWDDEEPKETPKESAVRRLT